MNTDSSWQETVKYKLLIISSLNIILSYITNPKDRQSHPTPCIKFTSCQAHQNKTYLTSNSPSHHQQKQGPLAFLLLRPRRQPSKDHCLHRLGNLYLVAARCVCVCRRLLVSFPTTSIWLGYFPLSYNNLSRTSRGPFYTNQVWASQHNWNVANAPGIILLKSATLTMPNPWLPIGDGHHLDAKLTQRPKKWSPRRGDSF